MDFAFQHLWLDPPERRKSGSHTKKQPPSTPTNKFSTNNVHSNNTENPKHDYHLLGLGLASMHRNNTRRLRGRQNAGDERSIGRFLLSPPNEANP